MEGVGELEFLTVAIARDACEVGVFATGKGCWDGDDGTFGGVSGGREVRGMGKGHEVGFGVNIIA